MLTQFGVRVNPADLARHERRSDRSWNSTSGRKAAYQAKEDLVGASLMREAERNIMLHVIDDQWKDHLLSMDHLKEGIGLRGYGQKDPLVEYKKESYDLYQDMMDRIEDETVRYLYFLRFEQSPQCAAVCERRFRIRGRRGSGRTSGSWRWRGRWKSSSGWRLKARCRI